MSLLKAVTRWITGDGGSKSAPRSRVRLPAAHDVPPDILRALWALNPSLDVYILPDGRVWLLLHEEERARIQVGREMLAQSKSDGIDECKYPYVTARLMADGWSMLDEIPYRRLSAGVLEQLAQRALYRRDHERRALERELLSVADSTRQAERRAAVISERIRAEARSDWKWAARGRRHFSSRGRTA